MSTHENNHPTTHTGTCLCGGVSFTVQGQPNAVFCCYCGDCSKGAGGPCQIVSVLYKAYSFNPVNDFLTYASLQTASYYSSRFELKDPYGLMTRYTISDTVSGLPKKKGFCGRCGCTLFTIPARVFTTSASDGSGEIVIRISLIQNG